MIFPPHPQPGHASPMLAEAGVGVSPAYNPNNPAHLLEKSVTIIFMLYIRIMI